MAQRKSGMATELRQQFRGKSGHDADIGRQAANRLDELQNQVIEVSLLLQHLFVEERIALSEGATIIDLAQQVSARVRDQSAGYQRLTEAMKLDNYNPTEDIVKAAIRRFEHYYGPDLYRNNDPVFGKVVQRLRDVMNAYYPSDLGFHSDGDYVGTAATLLEKHSQEKAATDLSKTHTMAELVSKLRSTPEVWLHEVAQLLENHSQEKVPADTDLSIGTLITWLGNKLKGLKGRREFSAAFTKLQEVGFWYREGLQEVERDRQAAQTVPEPSLDPTKPWMHYVPIQHSWSGEEINKAIAKYTDAVQGRLGSIRSFERDVFTTEVDGKFARIIVIG